MMMFQTRHICRRTDLVGVEAGHRQYAFLRLRGRSRMHRHCVGFEGVLMEKKLLKKLLKVVNKSFERKGLKVSEGKSISGCNFDQ